jgi:hypothetical protein
VLWLQRFLLWQLRNEIVEPFGETAQQVFARVSAMRDRLDGPQVDDQVRTAGSVCWSC